jgi:hypothetical protein
MFGLLPLGPSASPAGAVASLGVSGTAAIGSALVLGITVSATLICAVGVYALAVGGLVLGDRARPDPDPFARRRCAGLAAGSVTVCAKCQKWCSEPRSAGAFNALSRDRLHVRGALEHTGQHGDRIC